MITLYGFGEGFGLPDASPFVLKLHAYMTLTGIDFDFVGDADNLRQAPKGKLPFISDDGEIIPDSFFILEHLKQKHGDPLDEHLSEQDKALSRLLAKSLEENLYWVLVASRWAHEPTWQKVKAEFFDSMPFPIKYIIPIVARKGVLDNLKKHGMGRHSEQEQLRLADVSLNDLSVLLGDKPYFFGGKVTTFDIVAYSLLAQMTMADLGHPLSQLAKSRANLVDFCDRVHQLVYPA